MADLQLDKIAKIIAGGKRSRLAVILGISRATVSGWAIPGRRARGMCGTIPEKYWPAILAEAQAQGVEIKVSDMVPGAGDS